ncbi:MAG TPA: hypothetical protein VE780_13720 [Thermoleophilaceae bacterium]|nr:hypothetical protein [Thermoleophilaceae bacterium]
MADRSSPPRPGAAERALAWLFTGPLGHLYSAVVDLAVGSVRYWLARARGREP